MKKILIYTILILGAITVLFPFVWMILTSLKTYAEATAIPPVVVSETFMFSNYRVVLEAAPFLQYTINSILVAVCSTFFVLITSVLAAFMFAKFDFPFKNLLLSVLLATLMVPAEMMIITNFETIASMNLYNTRIAIFLPYTASVFYLYMIIQFFETIPHTIYLAAKVDGTSDFKFLTKILVPLSKPILVTVAILNIISSWNAYLWPMLVIDDIEKRTLPFGLVQFQTESGSAVQLEMAAAAMMVIPIIILFIATRKFIVGGLTKGSIKG